MSAEENKAVARRWFEEMWNKGNRDLIDELVDADSVSRIPGSPDTLGTAGWKQRVSDTLAAFPDLHFAIED